MMGLAVTKQTKRIIKGLGGVTTVSKGTCTLSLHCYPFLVIWHLHRREYKWDTC